jgi:hypothetical protein
MEQQVLTTSFIRSTETTEGRGCSAPHGAAGLGRVRISGALRAFIQDVRGVAGYPAGS